MRNKKISKKLKRGLLVGGLTALCIIPATTISLLSIVSCSSSTPNTPGPNTPGGPTNDHEKPSEPGNGDLKPGDTTTKIEVSRKYGVELANESSINQQTGIEFKAQRILTNFVNGNVDALNKELDEYIFDYAKFKAVNPNDIGWFNKYFDFDSHKKELKKEPSIITVAIHPIKNVTPDFITYPNLYMDTKTLTGSLSDIWQGSPPDKYSSSVQIINKNTWSTLHPKGPAFPTNNLTGIGNSVAPKINVLVGYPGNFYDVPNGGKSYNYQTSYPIYYSGTNNPVSIDDMLTANLYFSDISDKIINSLYTFNNPDDVNKVYLRLKLVSRCDDKYDTSGINQYIGTNLLINYSLAVKPQYVKNYNVGDETVLANTNYDLLLPLETKTVSVGGGQAEWDRVMKLSNSSSWSDFINNHYHKVSNLKYNASTKSNELEIVDLNSKIDLIKKPINFGNTYEIVEPSNDYWISMYSTNNTGWYRPEATNPLSQFVYENRNQLTPDLFTSTLVENNGPIKSFAHVEENGIYNGPDDVDYKYGKALNWANRRVDASQYFKDSAAKAREQLFSKYFKVLLTLNKTKGLVEKKYSTIFYSETGGPLTSTVMDKKNAFITMPERNYFVINNPLFNTGYGYNGFITNQGIYNSSNDLYEGKEQTPLTNYPLNPRYTNQGDNLMYLSKFLFSNNFPINIFTDDSGNYDFSKIESDVSYYENVAKFYSYLLFNDTKTPFHKNKRANANQRLYLINWFPEITMDYQLKLSPFVLSNENPTSEEPYKKRDFTYYWNPSFGTFCENWDFEYFKNLGYENFLPTYGTMYSLVFGLGFFADQINIHSPNGKGTYNPETVIVNSEINDIDTPSFFKEVVKDYKLNFLFDNYLTNELLLELNLSREEAIQTLEQLLNPAKVPVEAKNWLM